MALLVSGGHSRCCSSPTSRTTCARSVPRSTTPREAFDKVACVLGLPFPGGPHVDRAAWEGNAVAIDFPRGLTSGRDMERHRFDFSFSGLKTSVAQGRGARALWRGGAGRRRRASFQEAVVDVLTRKAVLACRENGVENLQIGVVSPTPPLRAMAQSADAAGITLRVPRPGLRTDNGAMVAALGAQMVLKGRALSDLALPADSSMPGTVVQA